MWNKFLGNTIDPIRQILHHMTILRFISPPPTARIESLVKSSPFCTKYMEEKSSQFLTVSQFLRERNHG